MSSNNPESSGEEPTAGNTDFVAREYQVDILEKAISENVIVFLPTGAGKTFIAVMLIKQYLSDIKKKYSEGGKRVFFLVNTTALAKQQADAIRNLLPIEVGEYTGELGVDYWEGSKWQEEQDKHNVLVMTAQIYLDMICHGYTKLNQVCLLIFDECHHAVNKHPMRQIMMEIDKSYLRTKPKILGLTATLLNGDVELIKVQSVIENLEATFNAKVVRALNKEMVKQYAANPVEQVLLYNVKENRSQFYELIEQTLAKFELNLSLIELPELMTVVEDEPPNAILINELTCKPLKKVKLGLKDALKISDELGLFAADISLLSLIIQIERFKMVSHDSVYRVLCSIETAIHYLRKRLVHLFNGSTSETKPLAWASDKVIKLSELLKNFPDSTRAIIFVDRRSTAHALHHIFFELSQHNTSYKNIKSDYVIGVNQSSNSISRENLLNRKKNRTVLKQFNQGSLNVLFASNVIEEGVDIRACNLVVKFDMPTTFRSYTQSKGRARHKDSKFIIFAPCPVVGQEFKINDSYNKFKNIEAVLNGMLCDNKGMEDDSSGNNDDDDIAFEFVTPFGSKVTAFSAISLINRYCSVLPQDKFCKLTTLWWIKRVAEGGKTSFVGYLRLPVNSPLKETIEGIPRKSKYSAKRLVAFEACKRLYKLGEFDSHFLPLGSTTVLLEDENLFPKWDENYISKKMIKGMQRQRRFFDKHYSKWECNSKPTPGADVFLHIIKITPSYPYPDTSRLQAFYNLLLHDSTFCILSTHSWPELPAFPLFMNVGEVKAEILSNSSFIKLTQEEISDLLHFHKLLFSDALSLLKNYCEMNPDYVIDDYIIAPAIFRNSCYLIDWDTVKNHRKRFPEIKPKPFEKRLDEPVTEEGYDMKIVIPWYRQENYNLKYVVTKVRTDETPKSQFPSQNYKSYAEYFHFRYNQKIYDMTQPMLEVRAISSKINCILPRAQYNSKRQKKEDDGFEETLVPELCYLITFPAWYLVKVTLLPSALHRVHHLLIAEELRQKIAQETNLGSLQIPPYLKWKELKVDKFSHKKVEVDEGSIPEPSLEAIRIACDDVNPIPSDSAEEEPLDISRTLNIDLAGVLHYSNFVDKPVDIEKIRTRTAPESPYKYKIHKPVAPLTIINGNYPGHGPEPVDILEVLTTAGSNDIINYERAELLGDCFLKFAVSLALYTFFPNLNEGKLTQIKGKIIGNMNLFFCGVAANIPGLLKVNPFDYNDWKVPGFSLPSKLHPYLQDPNQCSQLLEQLALADLKHGKMSELSISSILESTNIQSKTLEIEFNSQDNDVDMIEDSDDSGDEEQSSITKIQALSSKHEYLLKHLVPEKVVSDSIEALISVYVQNFGVEGGFRILHWLGVLPDSMSDIDKILYSVPPSPDIRSDFDLYSLLPNIEELEASLGYTFQNKAFALQALSHSSHPHNMTDCYQRFEFLGDAILDFVLTAYIFEECKDMSPGDLTDLRSALVNNVTFACLTVRHRFHTHLLYKACKLTDIISRFVRSQEIRNHEISHEVFYLIEESNVQVAECIDVPKVLGDIFEALIGAVYLDSGRNLNSVWKVVYNIMEDEISKFSKDIPKNPIRVLYEKFPTYPPKFGKSEVKGSSVLIPLEIVHDEKHKIFHGIGENKYFAKLAASKIALKYFKLGY